jgi:hypothetical protein
LKEVNLLPASNNAAAAAVGADFHFVCHSHMFAQKFIVGGNLVHK